MNNNLPDRHCGSTKKCVETVHPGQLKHQDTYIGERPDEGQQVAFVKLEARRLRLQPKQRCSMNAQWKDKLYPSQERWARTSSMPSGLVSAPRLAQQLVPQADIACPS